MKKRFNKILAAFLAINLTFQGLFPIAVMALTGGPSTPEVQSFEPIGTSEMVDVSTGDFTYNIPLMDVGGYPINISYHGGTSMDQEASWVGLGWNVNCGTINRNMRGLPDDFNGDIVKKELNLKPNRTYNVKTAFGVEVFGLKTKKVGLEVEGGLGITYNNYRGVSLSVSSDVTLSTKIGKSAGKKGCLDLGLNSSSSDGLTISASVNYEEHYERNKSTDNISKGSNTVTLGSSFNSRAGLGELTIKATNVHKEANRKNTRRLNLGSSYNLGGSTYTPSVSNNMINSAISVSLKFGGKFYGVKGTYDLQGGFSQQVLSSKFENQSAYGYIYSENSSGARDLMDYNRENDGSFTRNTPHLALTNFTYDIYSVSGQGVGGSYRPFRNDFGTVREPLSTTTSSSFSLGVELGSGNTLHNGFDATIVAVEGYSGPWTNSNLAKNKLAFKKKVSGSLFESVSFKEAGEKNIEADENFYEALGKGDAIGVDLKSVGIGSFDVKADSKFNYYAKALDIGWNYPIRDNTSRLHRAKRNQLFATLSKGEMENIGLENNSNLFGAGETSFNHHIGEITTLKNDGTRYVYGIAAYNVLQEETSFSVNATQDSPPNTVDPNTGLVNYKFTGDPDNCNRQIGMHHFRQLQMYHFRQIRM